MDLAWYQQDRDAVVAALRRGERPDVATTMSSGPLDELVALHLELGGWEALNEVAVERTRAGVPDALVLRTLATLPFVREASLSGAAGALYREPAILLQLGWAPVQIRAGCNQRHRHPDGRQSESLPCHVDTLRDTLRRVSVAAWERAQRVGLRALYRRRLIRGKVYAIDGTGLGTAFRLVSLVCVSGPRPIIVAWRLLEGTASEKGQEATVTRELVEQALALGGPACIGLLLADALYADGPLLAWLKYAKGIDALVPLPADRRLYEHLQGMARSGWITWRESSYLRTLQGHKGRRTVAIAAADGLRTWASFVDAAAAWGAPDATLWACLIREVEPTAQPVEEAWALVSTRPWPSGFAALQAFRPRWHIEDDNYRELKEGWGLEEQRWGRDAAAAHGRTTLTCLAFNTAQVYRTRAGAKVAQMGIRRLRQQWRPAVGAAPAVIYVAGYYAVLPLEELLAVLGVPVHESLLPAVSDPPPPAIPP